MVQEAVKKSPRRIYSMKISINVCYSTDEYSFAINSECKHIEMWTDRDSRSVIEFIVIYQVLTDSKNKQQYYCCCGALQSGH